MEEKHKITNIDLDKDFEASAKRLEELRDKRDVSDIPLSDEYWKAQRKHQQAHNK